MIAEQLAEYVNEKGIRQSAIAEATGMTRAAICETLAGRRKLGADEFINICDFLEVPYERFIKGGE